MRCYKIINRGKFAPGKILVGCMGQNQKDAREGAKGEDRHCWRSLEVNQDHVYRRLRGRCRTR